VSPIEVYQRGTAAPPAEYCEGLHTKLKLRAIIGAGSAAVVVIVGAWALSERGASKAEAAAIRAEASVSAAVQPVVAEVRANKVEALERDRAADERARDVQLDLRAVWRFNLDRNPAARARLEKEPSPLRNPR